MFAEPADRAKGAKGAYRNGLEAEYGDEYKGWAAAAVASEKAGSQLKKYKFQSPVGRDNDTAKPKVINNEHKGDVLKKYVNDIFDAFQKDKVDCKDTVIALATAGMRVPAIPATAMSKTCARTDLPNGCRFDTEWCRVTPGTEEGWYEWVAIHTGKLALKDAPTAFHATGAPAGILSMGGASAQLAVPLTADKVAPWEEFMRSIAAKQGDYFTKQTHPLREDYWKNFIDIKKKDDTPYWNALGSMRSKAAKAEYVAVGIVSFLGLADRTPVGGKSSKKHIMGGVNSFASLVKTYVLNHQEPCNDWASCLQTLERLLMDDPFFEAVAGHLRTQGHISQPFVVFDKISPLANYNDPKDIGEHPFCTPRTLHGDATKTIYYMNTETFNSCNNDEMIQYFNKKCGTLTEMKSAATIEGSKFNTCGNTLARIAYTRILFMQNSVTNLPKRPVVNLLALSRTDLGEPKEGAMWVWRHSQQVRTNKAVARCVPPVRPKGKNVNHKADEQCLTKTTQEACVAPCRWVPPRVANQQAPRKPRYFKRQQVHKIHYKKE